MPRWQGNCCRGNSFDRKDLGVQASLILQLHNTFPELRLLRCSYIVSRKCQFILLATHVIALWSLIIHPFTTHHFLMSVRMPRNARVISMVETQMWAEDRCIPGSFSTFSEVETRRDKLDLFATGISIMTVPERWFCIHSTDIINFSPEKMDVIFSIFRMYGSIGILKINICYIQPTEGPFPHIHVVVINNLEIVIIEFHTPILAMTAVPGLPLEITSTHRSNVMNFIFESYSFCISKMLIHSSFIISRVIHCAC